MITDFGKRIIELNKLSKQELHEIVGSMCGIHVSALSKAQLRRTKRQLVQSIMLMSLSKYDRDGMLHSRPFSNQERAFKG